MQQHSLLATKLYIPPIRPELVSRLRLIERLNEGLHRKLTLVSAPAGFGKTTVISEWLAGCEQLEPKVRVAWLSLDESDNDPARFLAYVIAALRTIKADIGKGVLSALQSPQPPPVEAVLISLINEIAAIPGRAILVLDDHHTVESSPIDRARAFLLERLPSQMHLVIASREDPHLPLARLRAGGQLTELRATDLRFTTSEAAEFLNQAMGLDLSVEEVAALEKRTEGWIAGLQLAALALQGTSSMQGRKDTSGLIRSFSGTHRYVLDYLVEEVLEQQSESVQTFLLHTSILDRLTSSLCDAVRFGCADPPGSSSGTALTDQGNGQAILEMLGRANLFIVPLDEQRCWYRYHRLFADLLRQRLRRERPDLVPELHRRAGGWYEREGLLPEAVGHLLGARDFDRAAQLVEQAAWSMLARGEMTTLLGWLEALPEGVKRARPRLSVLCAWALALTGQMDLVEPCLLDLDLQPVAGEVAALRAYVADLAGDLPQAGELGHQALELLPKENLFLRSIVALILGTSAYPTDGGPEASIRALAQAATLGRAAGKVHLDVTATCTLGHVQMMQGQLHRAAETFERAFQIATSGGKVSTLFVGLGHAGMAEVLYEWNDLDRAMDHARKSIEMGERAESVHVLQAGYSYIPLAQLHHALGDRQKAFQILQKAEQFAQRCKQSHVKALVLATRTRMWLAQGDLAAAFRWAQEYQQSPTGELEYEHEFENITLSQVFIAQGRLDSALALLARLLQAAEAMGRIGRLIQILSLQALAYQEQGDGEQALAAWERALSLAKPEGYVRTFVDAGEPMARLLYQALSRGIEPDYCGRLLAAFQTTDDADADIRRPTTTALDPSSVVRPSSALVEPLSEREIEVLELIAEGLTNPEIASRLFVSLNTVKAHARNIYGKLGVHNRTQAVTRARTLGILSST